MRKRESVDSAPGLATDRIAPATNAPTPAPSPVAVAGGGQRAEPSPAAEAARQRVPPAAPTQLNETRQSGSDVKQQIAQSTRAAQKTSEEPKRLTLQADVATARPEALSAQRDKQLGFTSARARVAALSGCYELQEVTATTRIPVRFALDSVVAEIRGDSVWYQAHAADRALPSKGADLRWTLLAATDTAGSQLVARTLLLGTSDSAVLVRIVVGGVALAKVDAGAVALDRGTRSAELTARPIPCPR
jgi:hypothetical protein